MRCLDNFKNFYKIKFILMHFKVCFPVHYIIGPSGVNKVNFENTVLRKVHLLRILAPMLCDTRSCSKHVGAMCFAKNRRLSRHALGETEF